MAAGTPEFPTITTEGAWQKIATSVTTGTIERLKSNYAYYKTYVATAAGAPTIAISKARQLFGDSNVEEFSHSVAVDIYIYLVGTNSAVTETSIANSIQVNI